MTCKRFVLGFLVWVLLGGVSPSLADEVCTLVAKVESGQEIHRSGEGCGERYSSGSTFKLALALMGFDSGELVDPKNPAEPYRSEYSAPFSVWRQTIDPTLWLRHSVVWYSQVLTRRMGMKVFQSYVDAFEYGNRDLSGDPGADNGLTRAWLSSSLKTTPEEQVGFLRRLLLRQLPVSKEAFDKTFASVEKFSGSDGWQVRGKTGTVFQLNADGTRSRRQSGWFVGWAEKDDDRFVFARLIKEDQPDRGFAGSLSKESLLHDLGSLIGVSQ